ncbi:MAG: hypothetical protein K2Z81_05630, partial [Cyanobacteria bacterium]|nr:hypothetical protein [Cyanobacteriota bacterium]
VLARNTEAVAVAADRSPCANVILQVKAVAQVAAPFLLMTIVYFAIRYLCLGTFVGGYQGSIGQSQFANILAKWSDLDTLGRLFLPFNKSVFAGAVMYRNLLLAVYFAASSLVLSRVLNGEVSRRWLLLLLVWAGTCLLPIYQLWGLGYNLDGSRFVFFLTAPLSVLLPVMLLAPSRSMPMLPGSVVRNQQVMAVLSISTLFSLSVLYARITCMNNLPWIHAGKETRAVREEAHKLAASIKDGQHAAVVGIPKDEGGAHMILNGATFDFLLTPPFAEKGLAKRFFTFDSMLFGDPQKINYHHFSQSLNNSSVTGFYRWDSATKSFVRFNPGTRAAQTPPLEFLLPRLSATASSGQSAAGAAERHSNRQVFYPFADGHGFINSAGRVVEAREGLGFRLEGLNVHPASYDYLELEAAGADAGSWRGKQARAYWISSAGRSEEVNIPLNVRMKDGRTLVHLCLSDYWQWYGLGRVDSLVVVFPPVAELEIQGARLLPRAFVAPQISIPGASISNRGEYRLSADSQIRCRVAVDASKVLDTESIDLEVFNSNFFVDDLKADASAQELKAALRAKLNQASNIATFNLNAQLFDKPGFVQVRARCLDHLKSPVSEYSEPITLRVK